MSTSHIYTHAAILKHTVYQRVCAITLHMHILKATVQQSK